MAENDAVFLKQMQSMSLRAEQKSVYGFTDFLTLSEQAMIRNLKLSNAAFFGGHDLCERKMARFGDPEEFGYEEPYPIACLKIEPRSQNFSDELSHRDLLGALMNLGIERRVLGDIFLKDNVGYLFCTENMAPYIGENLLKVKHTYVSVSPCESLPEAFASAGKTVRVNVPSMRADACAAAVFKLSRGDSEKYFSAKRVFLNDMPCENGGKALKEGDRLTVRGLGKFIFKGAVSETKKGRYFIEAEVFGG